MSNISRFDPFNLNTNSPIDEVFEGFFRPVIAAKNINTQIKIDVHEDNDGYKVHAEIPGAKKEDIHVDIEGNQVYISAETRRENEVKEGAKLLRSERYYGKTSRSFILENEVDESKAAAEYKDGVLELVLPKKVVTNSKRLEIR